MGGITKIILKDTSEQNIVAHNTRLDIAGVPKKHRFYGEADIIAEYEYFKANDGNFPEDQFPKDKINSLNDFKKYWSTEALGEVFVPKNGTLTFDCYFGRTSEKAMRAIGKYVVENRDEIKETGGSFSTFIERGMTKLEREIIAESGILDNY